MSSKKLVRSIIAHLAYKVDHSQLVAFNQTTAAALDGIQGLGKSLQNLNKQKFDAAIKQARLEKEKMATEIKKNQAALVKERIETQKNATSLKQAQIASKKLADEIRRKREEERKESGFGKRLDEQRTKAEALANQVQMTTRALGAFLAVKVTNWSKGLAKESEQAQISLAEFTSGGQLQAIEKRAEAIREKTADFFHTSEIKQAAAEYFRVDKNMRRLSKSMGIATVKAPLIGRSFGEITEAMKEFYTTGSTGALEEMGILDHAFMERQRKLGTLRLDNPMQREAFLDRHIQLTKKQKKLAQDAYNGILGTEKRGKNLFKGFGVALGRHVAPTLSKFINMAVRVKRWAKKTGMDKVALDFAAWAIVGGSVLLTIAALSKGLQILGLKAIFVKGVFIAWTVVTKTVTAAMWLLTVAQKALTIEFWLILGAIGLVVAAIYLLWKAFKGTDAHKFLKDFCAFALDVFSSLLEAAKTTWKFLKKLFSATFDFSSWGLDKIEAAFKSIWELVSGIWEKITGLFKGSIFEKMFSGKMGDMVANIFTKDLADTEKKVNQTITRSVTNETVTHKSSSEININMGDSKFNINLQKEKPLSETVDVIMDKVDDYMRRQVTEALSALGMA